MAEKKQSSKWVIMGPHGIYFLLRSSTARINPGTFSLLGCGGAEVEGVVKEALMKVGLETTPESWTYLGGIDNPTNNEVNHLWLCELEVEELTFRPSYTAGLLCFFPRDIWKLRKEYSALISPALASIMDGWRENEAVRAIFGRDPAA